MPFLALAQGTAQAWDNLVSAAKREGRVVVIGPPDPEVRKTLPVAFKARFGITVEYLGGRTSEQADRLRSERGAGVYTVDVTIGGVQSMATIFHREKMLIPLRPELILPEVVDGSKWKKGALWFCDPEEQYVLRLTNSVQSAFYINTSKVNPGELRSARDLLDPKWQGKISTQDPTVPGSGSNTAAQFYVEYGKDFVKGLYVDQKPMISRDSRQLTDWLLRGIYPIAFNADSDQIEKMRLEGLPVMEMGEMPDMRRSVSAGFGLLAVFTSAPHPAAAKLFANWIASKDGLEVWSRANQASPTRNDIDEASFLAPGDIPRPGVEYFDTYDWTFTMTTKEQVRLWMKELLGR
jgi:iron(III) transport system substrate-binding protein